MKTCAFFILLISSWTISGCSTNVGSSPSIAKYEDNPASYDYPPTRGDFNELYEKYWATADLVLETKDWNSFEETKPVYAAVDLEALGTLLHAKNLPGHGVAVVVFPNYVLPQIGVGAGDRSQKIEAEIRQMLKDAGFVEIHFFGRNHGVLMIPIP